MLRGEYWWEITSRLAAERARCYAPLPESDRRDSVDTAVVTVCVTTALAAGLSACPFAREKAEISRWQRNCTWDATGRLMQVDDEHEDHPQELYANSFRVGFNPSEFLLDFGRQFEGAEARYYARIIMVPARAKALLELLGGSVRDYEEKFGRIAEETDT